MPNRKPIYIELERGRTLKFFHLIKPSKESNKKKNNTIKIVRKLTGGSPFIWCQFFLIKIAIYKNLIWSKLIRYQQILYHLGFNLPLTTSSRIHSSKIILTRPCVMAIINWIIQPTHGWVKKYRDHMAGNQEKNQINTCKKYYIYVLR
jgi:hypothetical protein